MVYNTGKVKKGVFHMKIYIVENVRPDYQVFLRKEDAINFAFKKANGSRHANVWFEPMDGHMVYKDCCLNPERNSDSHITIIEREVIEE